MGPRHPTENPGSGPANPLDHEASVLTIILRLQVRLNKACPIICKMIICTEFRQFGKTSANTAEVYCIIYLQVQALPFQSFPSGSHLFQWSFVQKKVLRVMFGKICQILANLGSLKSDPYVKHLFLW